MRSAILVRSPACLAAVGVFLACLACTVSTASIAGPAQVLPRGGSCEAQSGALQLKVKTIRSAGISPLLVFFDATATTDAAIPNSVSQDVTFAWAFGDAGASGTGTWAHGANPSRNSMNLASGIVAAHLYRVASRDTDYTATVTATDGTNMAICRLEVTAYDPGGPNGFPGASTTCVSASIKPVPGSGGCPSGAKVLKESRIQSVLANAYGNGRRVLFKCGETFSGDTDTDNLTAVKWAIGAYGGCEDTQTNRPVMANSGQHHIFEFSDKNGNGTISDLDCEGDAAPYGGCIWGNDDTGIMYQVTLYNLYSNNEKESFAWNQCSQCGLVQVDMNDIVGLDTEIGTYINIGAFSHYPLRGNDTFNDVAYQAVIGSHFDGGTANFAHNAETVRIYGCQECYIADNDFLNAGPYYAQLKLHAGGKDRTWSGQYTEYVEISDNHFGGTSGANAVEIAPQNSSDERLRYIVAERNVFDGVARSGRQLMISGVNITARNNVFLLQKETSFGIQICQRGIEPPPRSIEIFNNTFYAPSGSYSNAAISAAHAGCSDGVDAADSHFANNMGYFPDNRGGNIPMVAAGTGTGNSVKNNTTDTSRNPAWIDASGTMKKITDWKPTAYYLGGTNVPVPFDALGMPWSGAPELGAVHH